MTSLDEALRALEKKWREQAENIRSHIPAAGLLHCADELSELLDEGEDCAHSMKATEADGTVYCCDCGKALLTTRQEVAPVAYRKWHKAKDGGGTWVFETVSNVETCNLQRLGYEPLYTSTGQTSDARDGEITALRRCLGFFASVIKSGEPWTATCQSEYDAAMQQTTGGGE